jgi:hypothetical protein
MNDETSPAQDDLVAAYLAASPTIESTPALVKELAERFEISAAKVRSRLVRSGVYIAQVKSSLTDSDRRWIKAYFADKTLERSNKSVHIAHIATTLNVVKTVVDFHLKHTQLGLPVKSKGMPPSKRSSMSTKEYAEITKGLAESNFHSRLDGEGGWFANPLWILNSIVFLFLVALVGVAIKSVFN